MNPKTPEEETFSALVLARYEELPTQQRLVASFLLDHLQELPFLSVPELARHAGVSEATVVRFAQRIGYDGFSGLKTDLSLALRERVSAHEPLTPAGQSLIATAGDDTLSLVVRQEIVNIQQTIDALDRVAFDAFAVALVQADHVYVFGMGISAHLAALLAYLLVQIGVRTTALSTTFSSPLEQLVQLRKGDLLVTFSFPPYSTITIEMLREAREKGAQTASFCDHPTAPASRCSDHALHLRTENMMFTNSFSAASVLLNALVTEVALKNRERSARAVARIGHILQTDEGVQRR